MRRVALRIDTYGKTKKYGPDVYKVGHGEELLLGAGWKVVHQAKSYVYLSCPPGKGKKRPIVHVVVPDEKGDRAISGRPSRGSAALVRENSWLGCFVLASTNAGLSRNGRRVREA
jgi:hypothetical protein